MKAETCLAVVAKRLDDLVARLDDIDLRLQDAEERLAMIEAPR
jgi:hypothetical protein